MYDTVEYSYANKNRHLDTSDVLDGYQKAKLADPDAIVVLNDLDCGHWDVEIYSTDQEKQAFYRKKVSGIYNRILDKFRK